MSYIVLEVHTSYCVVLDTAGRFIAVANFGYQEGQIIDEIVPIGEHKRGKSVRRGLIAGLSALAACVVLFCGISAYNMYFAVYGSVYLTINPQVELRLNSRQQVLEIIGKNEDGRSITQGLSSKWRPLDEVSLEIVEKAGQLQMLTDGGYVMAELDSPTHKEWLEEAAEALEEAILPYLEENIDARLYIYDYNKDHPQPEDSQDPEPTATPHITHTPEISPSPKATQTPSPQGNAATRRPHDKDDDDDDDDDWDDDDDDWDDDDDDDDD